jgi:hypothetical protein
VKVFPTLAKVKIRPCNHKCEKGLVLLLPTISEIDDLEREKHVSMLAR